MLSQLLRVLPSYVARHRFRFLSVRWENGPIYTGHGWSASRTSGQSRSPSQVKFSYAEILWSPRAVKSLLQVGKRTGHIVETLCCAFQGKTQFTLSVLYSRTLRYYVQIIIKIIGWINQYFCVWSIFWVILPKINKKEITYNCNLPWINLHICFSSHVLRIAK